MIQFIQKVWLEYPIPFSVSIWGIAETNRLSRTGSCSQPRSMLNPADDYTVSDLVSKSLKELRSDICINQSMNVTGLQTYMPAETRNIISVKLLPRFQGNRYVKYTYDQDSKVLNVRFYPATIRYSVNVTERNVDNLEGDMLIYLLNYVLWKMASKEHTQLTSVTLNADNGEVNLTSLAEFRDNCKKAYEDLKPEILIYSSQT